MVGSSSDVGSNVLVAYQGSDVCMCACARRTLHSAQVIRLLDCLGYRNLSSLMSVVTSFDDAEVSFLSDPFKHRKSRITGYTCTMT
jgi:hypothetical protein